MSPKTLNRIVKAALRYCEQELGRTVVIDGVRMSYFGDNEALVWLKSLDKLPDFGVLVQDDSAETGEPIKWYVAEEFTDIEDFHSAGKKEGFRVAVAS